MHKETKGYFLLIVLVITGMAGRMSFNTITNHERHFLINHLKESKTELLNSFKDLSEQQLNFKTAAGKSSIKEVIEQQAVEEYVLWDVTDASLQKTVSAEKHSMVKWNDQELLKRENNREQKTLFYAHPQPVKIPWPNTYETINAFKHKRSFIIKYVRTTTNDMRNHTVQNETGVLDAYQVLLLLSADTKNNARRIEEIKADAAFPKH